MGHEKFLTLKRIRTGSSGGLLVTTVIKLLAKSGSKSASE
jgi:hypothetical protein